VAATVQLEKLHAIDLHDWGRGAGMGGDRGVEKAV
jgi:hypothetical protein